jgi:hypothetical protein
VAPESIAAASDVERVSSRIKRASASRCPMSIPFMDTSEMVWDVVTRTYILRDWVIPPRPPRSPGPAHECTGAECSTCDLHDRTHHPEDQAADAEWYERARDAEDAVLVRRLVPALRHAHVMGDLREWRRLYGVYGGTRHVGRMRVRTRRIAGGQCQAVGGWPLERCPNTVVDCHHWTYERLGCEESGDLGLLCSHHHQDAHHGRLRHIAQPVEEMST